METRPQPTSHASESTETGGPVRAQEERLRWLEVVTRSGLAQLTVDELLDELLDKVRELMSVDTAAVLLLDPSHKFLIAEVARGIEEEVHQGVRIPLGRGFAGSIAAGRHWVAIEQVDHHNVLNPILREKGIVSLLGVPLLAGGKVLGVLHVGTLTRRRFTEQDAQLLQMVADRAALATHSRMSQAARAAPGHATHLLPARPPEVPGWSSPPGMSPAVKARSGAMVRRVTCLGAVTWSSEMSSGRGLAAAQSMSQIRAVLRSTALRTEDPANC